MHICIINFTLIIHRYGQDIIFIDATYNTSKYDLSLFCICVKTNVGFSIVAQCMIKSETIILITKGIF